MKNLIIFLCLVLLLSCSLHEDNTPTTVAGPRLLMENGQITGFLSSATANDWAPQMVSIVAMGAPITNRYLYFLSDRDTPQGSSTTIYSIYRAKHVQGQVFENLELVYTNTNQFVSMIVANTNSYFNRDMPDIYLTVRSTSGAFTLNRLYDNSGSWGIASILPGVESVFPAGDLVTAGHIVNSSSGELLFVKGLIAGKAVLMPFVVRASALTVVNNKLFYPIELSLTKFNLGARTYLGSEPMEVRLPDGSRAFGFVISYGGQFFLAFNKNVSSLADWVANAPDPATYAISSFFTGERVNIVLAIDHPAGSIDRDPSFDGETGFYFSSNREGKFNLYYVPKSALTFEDKL